MPKVVDHDERRRQITDAVCRIALKGGLRAATFRQVATEAGVSVRLVQHYFGTKAGLLDTTLQHVGERATKRLMTHIEATDGSPKAVLDAFLKSFVPVDEESRMAGLMFASLHAESVVAVLAGQTPAGEAPPPERRTEVDMLFDTVSDQLKRGTALRGAVLEREARLITALITGLGQYVLSETMTPQQAYDVIDHHINRLFTTA